MLSAVVGRDLGRNYQIEVGYLGRFGRDLLTRRDLAMPLNLTDSRSGMDYFTAAQTIIKAAQDRGITGNSPARAFAAIPALAYWENLFPAAAAAVSPRRRRSRAPTCRTGPTGSRRSTTWTRPAARRAASSDRTPTSPNSTIRLAGISSIGRSNYHAMLLTLRKRYAGGTQFDVNYTLSKSEDMGSQVERGSAFGNFSNGGNSGLPDQLVRSGAQLRDVRFRRASPGQHQRARRAAVRPRAALRRQCQQRRQRP